MTKVITYGTYDHLHYGHVRLLERARALGDYLVVGVTADDFDVSRGKINVQQSLMERIDAIRATGLADEIIVEQYEGQKIDDIQRLGIDIFTVGSDWVGQFDYLKEYCKVVYLDRTLGISSTEVRSKDAKVLVGVIGDNDVIVKFVAESQYVNGVQITGAISTNQKIADMNIKQYDNYSELIADSDALFVCSHPSKHYEYIKEALLAGKHVIYESPIALTYQDSKELFDIAERKGCILYAGIKTAYSTAYARMILMAKAGKIGQIVSVDAVCTSLQDLIVCKNPEDFVDKWDSITAWGPTAMLPVFQLLGTNYKERHSVSHIQPATKDFDLFTRVDWIYEDAIASIKVAKGAKSESQLIISGTQGYIIVPAPWWKTDYFEIRYENIEATKRFFYQLEGEGLRNMIVEFFKSITHNKIAYINENISVAIAETIEYCKKNSVLI